MNLTSNELFKAVRYALYAGTTAVVGLSAAPVLAQDESSQQLETITVTGSNIRRVDIETSNPVITVDRAEIQKSGKLTVGDLLQQLPTIAGAANNPNVNNGGGTGGAFISLRGLGTNRTLVLIDGRRAINNDINAIPASAIERVEVLTSGASAVYGSDAIAGVVNFIMRKDYQGAELSLNYGVSDRDDGARKGYTLTFGHTSDRGSLFGGIDYNEMDEIIASHRDFAQFALLYRDGNIIEGGSLVGPGGAFLAGMSTFADCSYYGYGVADSSAPGGNGIPPGFRCYVGSEQSSVNDNYNYAPVNLITTPQERTNFFLNGNYKISDSSEIYAQVFHNETKSGAQLAALPVTFSSAGITVSADNPYNPFGFAIGRGGEGNFAVRVTGLGPRMSEYRIQTSQGRVGLRGSLFDTDWQYDVWANYGHVNYSFANINYLNGAAMSRALGADCTMPTAGVPYDTNTCLDIFHQDNPITQELLQSFYSLNTFEGARQKEEQIGIDLNGSLFDLPAGTVQLAVGANYRKFEVRQWADTVTITDPATSTCPAGSPSLCTAPYSGGYNLKEAYAEVFVPLLSELPFVHSLNITLGDRYSDYSSFGSTNNWKIALEYRPIEDLLLRGTVSKVFRAPNTSELFTGQASSYDTYTPVGNQPRSTSGAQVQTIFTGAAVSGFPIKPENGKSFDFGVVYDPSWLEGLSVSADYWRIYLLNNIDRPNGQTIVNYCYGFNGENQYNPSNPYCQAIHLNSSGSIDYIQGLYSSVQNIGRLDASGVDIAINYRLPELAFGNFNVGLNATYLTEYDNAYPGSPRFSGAGTYNDQFGNTPRWRALGSVGWQMGDFSASWQSRYIGHLKAYAGIFDNLEGGFLPIGSVTYHNVAFGYNIEPINTRIDLGVDNIGDKQPPLLYDAVTNANIDINTYDPIGRYYWGRVTVKF